MGRAHASVKHAGHALYAHAWARKERPRCDLLKRSSPAKRNTHDQRILRESHWCVTISYVRSCSCPVRITFQHFTEEIRIERRRQFVRKALPLGRNRKAHAQSPKAAAVRPTVATDSDCTVGKPPIDFSSQLADASVASFFDMPPKHEERSCFIVSATGQLRETG